MNISATFTKAIEVLRANGWIQHDYYDDDSDLPIDERPCCGIAAINIACGNEPDADLDGDALVAAYTLAAHLGHVGAAYEDLVDLIGERWNDAYGRTVDEVIARFHQVAAAEQEADR